MAHMYTTAPRNAAIFYYSVVCYCVALKLFLRVMTTAETGTNHSQSKNCLHVAWLESTRRVQTSLRLTIPCMYSTGNVRAALVGGSEFAPLSPPPPKKTTPPGRNGWPLAKSKTMQYHVLWFWQLIGNLIRELRYFCWPLTLSEIWQLEARVMTVSSTT